MTTVLLALALSAPAPKGDIKPAPASDHPLMGEWIVDSHVASGKPIARAGKPERIKVTRDRWKIGVVGMTESCLSIDATKEPPHIDIWVPVQGDDGPAINRGIYKLEGDTLTICYRFDHDRPTKLESLPRSGNYLIVLKRVQKK
jgi:uncharacterized protein (TIGR03067 family)